MRVARKITLTDEQQRTLERWARGRSTPARLVLRANIVLAAAQGQANDVIAETLGTSRPTVGRWRNRFAEHGLPGIEHDAPRPGRPSTATPPLVSKILRVTTQERPANATHWSVRTLAKHLRVGPSVVHRVWRQHGLQSHRTKTFKLSNDPQFEEKLRDIVGLYVSPPEHAVVLCVDEKSQIQALERTQKSLPIYPGRRQTMTHDYQRHGTTTLFAALNTLDGTLLADLKPRHRHREWLDFLKTIAATYPDVALHVICDNYATHKHPRVRRWLAKHPRIQVHFTPTSGSWLNLVERWFRELTTKSLRRRSFPSLPHLQDAIWDYIEHSWPAPSFCTRCYESVGWGTGRVSGISAVGCFRFGYASAEAEATHRDANAAGER